MWRFRPAAEQLAAPDLRTVRGKRGLYQRLNNHLHGRSSFVIKALNGKGARFRRGFKFRFVTIENSCLRALVEAFAISAQTILVMVAHNSRSEGPF